MLGLGVAGLGAAGSMGWKPCAKHGGRIRRHIQGLQTGGAPYGGGYLGAPLYGITGGPSLVKGAGPPQAQAPKPPASGSGGSSDMINNAMRMANAFKSSGSSPSAGTPLAGQDASIANDPNYVTAADWAAAGLEPPADAAAVGGFDLGTIGPGLAGDIGVDVAGDVGAGAAADVLPLLLLAKRGGGINRPMGGRALPGGMRLPQHNRIQLPMRAGLGMPSFVPGRRGFQDGGGESSYEEQFPDSFGNRFNASFVPPPNDDFAAVQHAIPDLTSGSLTEGADAPVFDTSKSAEVRAGGDYGDNALTAINQHIRGVGAAPSSAMAYDTAQPRAGLQAPPPAAAPTGPYSPPSIMPTKDRGLSPEFWQSLMAAGLGMAASRRHDFLGAVGEGGLTGLHAYTSAKEKEADIEMQTNRLNQAAKAEQDRIAQESRKYNELTADERAKLQQAREFRDVPVGYRRTQNGLEPIPGGPADPATIGATALAKMQGG